MTKYKNESGGFKLTIRNLLIVFGIFFFALFILLLYFIFADVRLPARWSYLPAILGIPCALFSSFLVIYVFNKIVSSVSEEQKHLLYNQNDNDKPKPFFQLTDLYYYQKRTLVTLILLWVLCFIVIISSIYLLWPGDRQGKIKDDHKIDLTLLQLNDIYEISPLDHGKISGLARIATLRKELLSQNKNTYTLLAGDFLSPSAMGTLYEDTITKKKIAGMQMLEGLNAAGLDLATFGNHEFDISTTQLTEAIDRSSFDWVSSNVMYNNPGETKRFAKKGKEGSIPTYKVISFSDDDGTNVNIGVIGLTIETPETSGKKRPEAYEDYWKAAGNAIKDMEGKCDFIIAVTHLELGMDKELATRYPTIKLIIGGHEHINSYDTVGNTVIAKADANVKTVYIHSIHFDKKTKGVNILSRLMVINDAIAEDQDTRKVVDKWNKRAHELLVQQRFEPCKIIDSLKIPLDGRESSVRTGETNLGKVICQSLMMVIKTHTDCSILNSGSIRLDDWLSGYITQYDIFRVLPYENRIVVKDIPGYILDSLLKTNSDREKDGSFLQYYGIAKEDTATSYYIRKERLAGSQKVYKVATNYFLGMGQQDKLNFLGNAKKYPIDSLPRLSVQNDMRKALIYYFEQNAPAKIKAMAAGDKIIPCY